MNDRPSRPILRLKTPPARPAPSAQWKCKPCGKAFEMDPALADGDVVRCPSCNARLGRAEQFRADGPGEGVRARKVTA